MVCAYNVNSLADDIMKLLFDGGRSETSLTTYLQSEEARLSGRRELWDRSSQTAFHKGYGFVCSIYVRYIGEHAAKCRELVTEVTKLEKEARTLKQKELVKSMLVTLHLIQVLDRRLCGYLDQSMAMFKQIEATLNEIITLELEAATGSYVDGLHSLFDMVRSTSVKIRMFTSVFQRYVMSPASVFVLVCVTLTLQLATMCLA